MQSKTSAFFEAPFSADASATETPQQPPIFDDGGLMVSGMKEYEFANAYNHRARNPDGKTADTGSFVETQKQPNLADSCSKLEPAISGKNLNKKRSYAQLQLNLGQSDFLPHTCSTCGIKYTPGEKVDEKAHKAFHNKYTLGIRYRGWKNVYIPDYNLHGPNIIAVSYHGPYAQRMKVQEIVKLMEVDLGEGWIYHKSCKAFLFADPQSGSWHSPSYRIVGCLIAETIKEAYKILPCSADGGSNASATTKKVRSNSTALQSGEVIFQREVMKRYSTVNSDEVLDGNLNGAIFCEKEPVSAICGIRAIWVAPSCRKQGIATKLLGAAQNEFYIDSLSMDSVSQAEMAFSQPTSAGKALATKYFGTGSFLVYKAENYDGKVVFWLG